MLELTGSNNIDIVGGEFDAGSSVSNVIEITGTMNIATITGVTCRGSGDCIRFIGDQHVLSVSSSTFSGNVNGK